MQVGCAGCSVAPFGGPFRGRRLLTIDLAAKVVRPRKRPEFLSHRKVNGFEVLVLCDRDHSLDFKPSQGFPPRFGVRFGSGGLSAKFVISG